MFSPLVKQSWMVSSVLLNSVNQGLVLSYPYCLLPALAADDSPFKTDLNVVSWLASATALAFVFGSFVASILMERLGRRISNAIMVVVGIGSWLLIYSASDITTLMVGRFLGGLSNIAGYTIGCCMVGECTTPRYRGVFLNLKTATACIGAMVMHVIGRYNWRTVALGCNLPLILALLVNFTWTESPSWLALKGKFKESEETFFWLKGVDGDTVKEFEVMIEAQKERMANTPTQLMLNEKILMFLKKFTKKTFIKPISVQFSTYVLTEAGCRHIFPAFANIFLGDLFHGETNSFKYTMIIDIITVAGNTVSCVLIKYFNRRTIIFCSGISCAVFLSSMSLYGYLESVGSVSSDRPWIMASMMILFFTVSNFGITALPIVLYAELFPLEHRESCMIAAGTLGASLLFIILKCTPILFATIHVYGTFAVLAVTIVVSLVYVYFALPETKDRTLEEIEYYFKHGKFLIDTTCNKPEAGCDVPVLLNTLERRTNDG